MSLIDREEYDKMRGKYTKMIEEAEALTNRMREKRKDILSDSYKDTGWITQFSKFSGLKELTREAVVSLIDCIYISEDKQIKIDFNYRNEIAYYQNILNQMKEVS